MPKKKAQEVLSVGEIFNKAEKCVTSCGTAARREKLQDILSDPILVTVVGGGESVISPAFHLFCFRQAQETQTESLHQTTIPSSVEPKFHQHYQTSQRCLSCVHFVSISESTFTRTHLRLLSIPNGKHLKWTFGLNMEKVGPLSLRSRLISYLF